MYCTRTYPYLPVLAQRRRVFACLISSASKHHDRAVRHIRLGGVGEREGEDGGYLIPIVCLVY